MSISLIAGLGNPGSDYEHNRHNVGFQVIDALADSFGSAWKESKTLKALIANASFEGKTIRLVKPLDYMNNSGQVLSKVCHYYKIPVEEMVILSDDINLDVGIVKLSLGKGAGGHNGIADILSFFENTFIWYRIGIGSKPHKEMDLKDYVLGNLTIDEKTVLTSCTQQFIKDLKMLIKKSIDESMNFINQRRKS